MRPNKTLGELSPADVHYVAKIPAEALRILWVDDYYDGPIGGIVEWEGDRHLFAMIDRSTLGHEQAGGRRRFWLIALTPEQLRDEEKWHDLFCAHVWTKLDYTGRPEHVAPPSEHEKFYGPYSARAEPDYSGNEVVGWFEL